MEDQDTRIIPIEIEAHKLAKIKAAELEITIQSYVSNLIKKDNKKRWQTD